MIARRFTALLLALFTLHLNLLGADFACARHSTAMGDGMSAHNSMPAADAAHTHSSAQGASTAATAPETGVAVSDNSNNDPPCEVPVQSNCCKALASCSVFYSASNELEVTSARNFRDMIALGAMTTPPSETAAPEPPPPKA